MSDMARLPQRPLRPGYLRRTIKVDGTEMHFTFYQGFASRITHTPEGGEEILVYQQEGVFKVPGGKAPDARSFLWIEGGPEKLDVELEIEDGPLDPPDYRGPIQSFEIRTRSHGEASAGKGRVRPIKGGGQVAEIRVHERGKGGVFPHMPGGGGGTWVHNDSITCPPHC